MLKKFRRGMETWGHYLLALRILQVNQVLPTRAQFIRQLTITYLVKINLRAQRRDPEAHRQGQRQDGKA